MEMETNSRNIFWGLVVKPGKRYETEVQEPFRITKACLEMSTAGESVSSLMIECDNNEEFIIANLSSSVFNETLDLAFNEGEKICFKVDGPGTVHLTGNLMDEDNLSPSGEDFSMLAGSDSEMESEEEEAGEKIQEVIEKSGKRKKVEEVKNQEVVAKKAKVDAEEESEESEDGDDDDESGEDETTDADTTANATTGDDDDDSDDSDEDDSEEEDSKEVEGAKPKQKKEEESKAKKAEAVKEDDEDEDSDSDEEDDSDDEEEEEEPKAVIPPTEPKEAPGAEPKLVKKKEVKGKEVAAAATPNTKSKAEDPKAEAKTPISEAKTSKAGTKTPKADVQTPKAEAKTSKTDAKTPKAEAKTPKAEAKTPKADAKTPKADAKTPKADAKTAKAEAKLTNGDVKTPKADSKTPKAEGKTPKADAKAAKAEAKTPKADAKAAKTDAKTPKAETKSEDKAPKTPKEKAAKDAAATPGKTPKRTLKGGVQVEELKEGSGSEVKVGNMVGMHYAGKLSSNNKQFDACSSPQKPFKFKIGTGQVIRGWDVGVLGMKVGGKRRLTIPAAMAYGKEGAQPDIPPNATLVFDVDCKFVK